MKPTGARPRLIGRSAELAVLEAELAQAASGEVRAVLVAGDPGLGKTHLVEELLARKRRSVLSLAARATPFSATAPFGLWIEALERHLRGMPAADVLELGGGRAAALSSLLPSVAAAGDGGVGEAPPRAWLLEALAVLAAALARSRPLAIFLDDLHLADASSWEALNYLVRNLVGSPVLVVAAARTGELAAQRSLVELLGALRQDGLLTSIRLGPLDSDGLADLARAQFGGAYPPAALVTWLEARSRGNPLFAIGLLRALNEEGADLTAPRLRRLPEDLQERVLSRVDRLEPADRACLETLAVLGGRVDVALVERITGKSAKELAGSLDTLVRARLVREEEAGRELSYELAHPLVQEAIYDGLGGARRRTLHRAVGQALAAAGRRTAAALHYARAAEPGDEEAIGVLLDAAGEAESQQSHREAMTLIRSAAELLPDADPRTLDALDRLAWLAGVFDDPSGIDALRRLERLAVRGGDAQRQASAQVRLMSLLYTVEGDVDGARRCGERALDFYAAAGQPDRVLAVRNEMAWLRGIAGDVGGQIEEASDVLSAARAMGETEVVWHTLGCLGAGCTVAGRFEAAQAALGEGLELSRARQDAAQVDWYTAIGGFATVLAGDVRAALRIFERAAPEVTSTEPLECWAFARWAAGDLEEAEATALQVVPWSPSGLAHRQAWALALAALSTAELGRPTEGRAHLARAAAVFGGSPFYWFSDVCTWAEGIVSWAAGEPAQAVKLLRQSAERLSAMGAHALSVLVHVDLEDLCLDAGDLVGALEARTFLGETARRLGGEFHGALANLSEPGSAAVLGRLGWKLLRARALARQGSAEAVEEAASEFVAIGARWRQERALGRLAGLGRAGRRAAASLVGARSLSARERDVAALAAQGLTAREIAGRLFISARTVETHLENAYTKLGLESKRDLVRRGRELGLIP